MTTDRLLPGSELNRLVMECLGWQRKLIDNVESWTRIVVPPSGNQRRESVDEEISYSTHTAYQKEMLAWLKEHKAWITLSQNHAYEWVLKDPGHTLNLKPLEVCGTTIEHALALLIAAVADGRWRRSDEL